MSGLAALGRGSPDLTGGEIMPKYPLAYYRQLPDIANEYADASACVSANVQQYHAENQAQNPIKEAPRK